MEGLFLLAHCSVTPGGAHARAQFQRRAAGGFVCIAFFNRSEHVQCGVKTLFQSRKKIMPFISKDWRSPGEEWVRYDGGWERKSIIIPSDSVNDPKHLDLDFGLSNASPPPSHQNKAIFEQKKDLQSSSNTVEAVATLNRQPLRRKNLSECDNSHLHRKISYLENQLQNRPTNQNQNAGASGSGINLNDHRFALQEHVRRIRGRLEHDDEDDDENQDPDQPKSNSPQRVNR